MNPDAALPIGIEIGDHAIEAVLCAGDTGFVYLASDPLLARQVAIKEYFPPSLAVRHAGTQMRARSASDHRTVMAGRDAFIEESRLLARLDHPALVRVVAAYDLHQTAYRVMPLHSGPTLAHARAERGVPPGDDWLCQLIDELLGALQVLHEAGIVHGHLRPDQVLLRHDDRPLLLGFGSAARVLAQVRDDGFLPPELGAGGQQVQRGPWTDLYGLAALSWFAVMGKAPPSMRPLDLPAAFEAAFGPPESEAAKEERQRLCTALAKALERSVAARPQSVAEMRALLGGAPGVAAEPKESELPPEPDPRVRAAIAAAVAGIPGGEPLSMRETPSAAAAPPVREGPPAMHRPAVPSGADGSPVQNAPTVRPTPPVPQTPAASATQQPAPAVPEAPRVPRRAEDPRVDAAGARAAAAAAAARAGAPAPLRRRTGASDEGPDTIPAFLSMPTRAKPSSTTPLATASRPEATTRARAEPVLMPPAPPGGVAADAGRPSPSTAEVEEPAAPIWAAPPPVAQTTPAPTGDETALPPWMADRPADPDALRPPATGPRRSGWAWAAAIVVGVAAGAVAWRWDAVQDERAARMAAAPTAAERSGAEATVRPGDPPGAATSETDRAPPLPDPATAPPTAAGEAVGETAGETARQSARQAAGPTPTPAEPAVQSAGVPPPGAAASPDAETSLPNAAAQAPPPASPARDGGVVAEARRPESAVAEIPEPAARTPRAAAPRPPARAEPRRTSAPAALPSPRSMCGDRANFSLVYCMQQQCRKPAYSAHPQCREFRRTGEVD